MMNSFWWGSKRNRGGGINWLHQDTLCKPKSVEGMGFKKLHNFNLAMLGKQGWSLLSKPNSLVVKVLKAYYFPKTSFVDAGVGYNPSYALRSIMAAKDVVIQGSRVQIRNGQSVLIGKDPWLLDMENRFVTSGLNVNISNARVSSLMESEHCCWDHDAVTDIFGMWDRDLILQIPLSFRRNYDLWYWLAYPRGSNTIYNCYKLLNPITVAPSS